MAEEEKGFVVKDRRMFSEDGRQTEETPDTPDATPPKESVREKPKEEDEAEAEEDTRFPEINFPTFILSLNSSALVQLGIIEDPATGKKRKNLPLAKQTIDIIGLLDEKTKGNISEDEEMMLKHILYDLRMIYVREKS